VHRLSKILLNIIVTDPVRRQAWARRNTCLHPLEMRKLVFVTVTNYILKYLNRQLEAVPDPEICQNTVVAIELYILR